jgi:hypothetical protein
MSNNPPKLAQMRVHRNDGGRAVRVFVDDIDVTHLVARVQSMTTLIGTTLEVVLTERLQPPSLGLLQ